MVNSFVFHYIWQLLLKLILIIKSSARERTQIVLLLQWHISNLHYFQNGSVEGKKTLGDNLQQGFGQRINTGAPSIYIYNSLMWWLRNKKLHFWLFCSLLRRFLLMDFQYKNALEDFWGKENRKFMFWMSNFQNVWQYNSYKTKILNFGLVPGQ